MKKTETKDKISTKNICVGQVFANYTEFCKAIKIKPKTSGNSKKLQIKKIPDRILASAALCVSAIPFAKIGFSDLIANLYSAFGYAGIVWLVMLIFTYIRTDGKG